MQIKRSSLIWPLNTLLRLRNLELLIYCWDYLYIKIFFLKFHLWVNFELTTSESLLVFQYIFEFSLNFDKIFLHEFPYNVQYLSDFMYDFLACITLFGLGSLKNRTITFLLIDINIFRRKTHLNEVNVISFEDFMFLF